MELGRVWAAGDDGVGAGKGGRLRRSHTLPVMPRFDDARYLKPQFNDITTT